MTTLDCADARADDPVLVRGCSAGRSPASGDELHDSPGPPRRLGIGADPRLPAARVAERNGPKQFHFDLACEDLAAVEPRGGRARRHGARRAAGGDLAGLLDPAGHPFCLTDAANW